MATIESLAPETLGHIFSFTLHWRRQYYSTAERTTLCSAALVCRKWRDEAQRALFQNLDFLFEGEHWLGCEARTRYRVEEVALAMLNEDKQTRVLAACRGVERLGIIPLEGVMGWGALGVKTLSGLRSLYLNVKED